VLDKFAINLKEDYILILLNNSTKADCFKRILIPLLIIIRTTQNQTDVLSSRIIKDRAKLMSRKN
jgi:hypothetical protein